jgi:uncharacterized lipoprotein YajG
MMRSLTILAGLFLLAGGQVALSADTANKPIVVAAAQPKSEAPKVSPASVSVTVSRVTRETSVPEGSLEKFGSVGLPQ